MANVNVCTINFYFRDLAEERGHIKCIDFLRNPEKAFMEQKRTQAATQVKLIMTCIVSFLGLTKSFSPFCHRI